MTSIHFLLIYSATGDVRIHEVSPDGRSVSLINMSSNKVDNIYRNIAVLKQWSQTVIVGNQSRKNVKYIYLR